MTKTPPPEILRDEFGRWTTVPNFLTPEEPELSKTPLWNSTEVREDFLEQHRENLKKYNKFFEWEHGINVAYNFPFDVKLCVAFFANPPQRHDVYRYDPMPKDWAFKVMENPSKAPDPALAKFDQTSFILKAGHHQGFSLKENRFETLEEARAILKDIQMTFINFCTTYRSVMLDPRRMSCPNCADTRLFNERANYPDTPDANIMLEPMKLYDTMRFHDCGKKT